MNEPEEPNRLIKRMLGKSDCHLVRSGAKSKDLRLSFVNVPIQTAPQRIRIKMWRVAEV
jgi:hypothetical protein